VRRAALLRQKTFFDCLRRYRRLLHPAKDDRTQLSLTTRVHAQMSRAKLRSARNAAHSHQRGRADVDLRITKRARRFVEKQLLASSPRVGNLFFVRVACPQLCVGMKTIIAWPLKAVAMAPCARSWMKQKRDAERRPCRDHPDGHWRASTPRAATHVSGECK
jgi:hypothetical protein